VSARGRSAGIRSILTPVDGSPSSRRAVQLAAGMARAFEARLTLLHVVPVHEIPVLMAEAEDPREEPQATLVLGEAAKRARALGVEPEIVVRRGHPAAQILRLAEATRPDLIVMGTRALSSARSVLMGSVSRAVARRAKSQVVLVR
jgi:nucleotide-binding universal stress UspA family protein